MTKRTFPLDERVRALMENYCEAIASGRPWHGWGAQQLAIWLMEIIEGGEPNRVLGAAARRGRRRTLATSRRQITIADAIRKLVLSGHTIDEAADTAAATYHVSGAHAKRVYLQMMSVAEHEATVPRDEVLGFVAFGPDAQTGIIKSR